MKILLLENKILCFASKISGMFFVLHLIFSGSLPWQSGPASAQQVNSYAPGVWRGAVAHRKPDLRNLSKLRFITENDYPPFNYLDEENNLTGFNIDLARAICDILSTECEIRAKPWDTLLAEVNRNAAEAAIASIRINKKTTSVVDFSDVYYHTPARFIARQDANMKAVNIISLKGKTVAVKENSAHQAYLKKYFPGIRIIPFFNHNGARHALKTGKVDLVFGDGISLVFWLNGSAASGCCTFVGGPYLEPDYFGEGVAIAVRKGNRRLREILNYAINQLRVEGRYEELFLRYFPINYY